MNPSYFLSFVIISVAALALFIERWKSFEHPASQSSNVLAVQPASYARNASPVSFERILFAPPKSQLPDTTAVILNWARLPNVVQIVGLLCQSSLDQTIAEIVVWNNSPSKLNYADFASARCALKKLKIHNSSSNLYFYARFIACSRASTRYCFIQDDDYLVWPEVINTLYAYVSEKYSAGIHLLPAHERLSSDLRTIRVGGDIHTSFAWLGHGAIIPRARVFDFLSLMNSLNISSDDLKMADNYFAIMSNTFVETWFDQGVELGGGQPFTVGMEGEERNRQHIIKATRMLESIVACIDPPCLDKPEFPYVRKEPQLEPLVHRAPCVGSTCFLEISIDLLPDNFGRVVPALEQMLAHEKANMKLLGEERRTHYINHPPSYAVDGNPNTSFCSYENAKEGDMILLNTLQKIGPEWISVELAFLVDKATEYILRATKFEMRLEEHWFVFDHVIVCADTGINSSYPSVGRLRECAIQALPVGTIQVVQEIRVRLPTRMENRWCIYEIWLRGTSS